MTHPFTNCQIPADTRKRFLDGRPGIDQIQAELLEIIQAL